MANATVRSLLYRTPEEEAARLERDRELARERGRRRRADPERRARDAESRRRRREKDPLFRLRDAERKRRRMRDPAVVAAKREMTARYYREHREEILTAKRRRRREDPGLHVLENFRRRQRKGMDTEKRKRPPRALGEKDGTRGKKKRVKVSAVAETQVSQQPSVLGTIMESMPVSHDACNTQKRIVCRCNIIVRRRSRATMCSTRRMMRSASSWKPMSALGPHKKTQVNPTVIDRATQTTCLDYDDDTDDCQGNTGYVP
ncbi:GRB10-interacting GYF protein 2 [Rhipicephalus sanguineus]|uniref:GRB10-interacting GYF protein 2 n=1 Tax=Rhipicephalus sanguineus TaxID=34632 RepID=UPI00189531CC|nr:GRB10-interacting GYF protein 2 [Rhipicephalus sanguineus]XP_037507920.1 GRB10-interacting GYF protein 2 [Rhipicephalus sanguineus]